MKNSKSTSPKNQTAEATMAEVATPTPLEPEDLTAFALNEDFHTGAAAKVLTTVPVRKPARESFVRTSDDPAHWQLFALIELKEVGKTYLVMPDVAAALRDDGESTLQQAYLVLSVDKRGNAFLWPLKVTDRENDWHMSARRAAELAKDKWLRLQSNMSAGCYDSMVASNQESEPDWPEESYNEVLKVAFRDRIVSDIDHDVLKELRGQF